MSDPLGPKNQIRLRDLQPWHVLKVTCFKSRHVANVSHVPLLLRFGQHRRLTDLEDRFACTECGNRWWGDSVQVHELARPLGTEAQMAS